MLKKVRRVIKFNQEARLKPYIEMNTELKKCKNVIAVFEKTMKNVTTKGRTNYLVSKSNYHTAFFFGKFISHSNKKKTDTHA